MDTNKDVSQLRQMLQSTTERPYGVQATPSARVLRAYQDYFELGAGRNLVKLADAYIAMEEEYGQGTAPTTSLGTLRAWSARWNWSLQCKLDEREIYHERREARLDSARAMAERQAQSSRILQQLGMKKLSTLVDKSGELTAEGQSMSPAEARRMLLEGAKLERDLFGGSELTSSVDDEISYE